MYIREDDRFKIPKDIPIDEPVLASHNGVYWHYRYYAGCSELGYTHFVWKGGATSKSSKVRIQYRYILLVSDLNEDEVERLLNMKD